MYLTKNGVTERFIQYECKNIPQVKNTIAELTKTSTANADWKQLCDNAKIHKGVSDSIDYVCFIENKEYDCSVNIGYDENTRSYIVWIDNVDIL